MANDVKDFQARLRQLDDLLRQVEQSGDPTLRTYLQRIVQAILDLHGAGLEKLLEHIANDGSAGRRILDACGRDPVVSGMLLLHDRHPLDLEARVRLALESVRPALRSHGGNVELIDIDDGVVRLRLVGSCHNCSSSAATTEQTIEAAVLGFAPEIADIEVEGLPPTESTGEPEARFALPLVST